MNEPPDVYIEFLSDTTRLGKFPAQCRFVVGQVVRITSNAKGPTCGSFECGDHLHYVWPNDITHGYVRVVSPLEILGRTLDG